MAKLILPIHSYRRGQSNRSRLINCYAEAKPEQSKAPIGLVGCPGVTTKGTFAKMPYRGAATFKGVLYAVSGDALYKVDLDGTTTSIGQIKGSGRVSISPNREALVIVTNQNDYTYDGTTLAEITDADLPNTHIMDVIEGYAIYLKELSDSFYASELAGSSSINGLSFGTAQSSPSNLVSLLVNRTVLIVFGVHTSEIWWVAGTTPFPLERIPNGVIEHGCIAERCPVKANSRVFWIDDDRIPRILDGVTALKISNHAIDEDLRKVTDPTDIYGFSYTSEGHIFIVFLTDNGTLVYDSITQEWHERRSLNNTRWRVDDVVKAYNKQFAFDSETGKFGLIDESISTEFGDPIRMTWVYPIVYAEGRLAAHKRLETMLDTGGAKASATSSVIGLDVSDDGGQTWDLLDTKSVGLRGEYNAAMIWTGLGSSRNRSYRHWISDDIRRVIVDTQLEVAGGRL